MKRVPVILLFLFFWIFPASLQAQVQRREVGNLVIEDIPEIPERITDRMFQYQNTRSAAIADWIPGGEGMLIGTRFAETWQLHHVATPGGARQQITFFPEPVRGGDFSPNPEDNRFIFAMDEGGGEFYQLYLFDFDTRESTLLTDGKSRNGGEVWSNKGDRFVFYSTRRNDTDWDLYLADPDHPASAELVLSEGGLWFAEDWSPQDDRLLVGRYVSANESYLHILDLASRELTPINPSEEKIAYGSGLFAKDGSGIYLTSDQGSEFKQLRFYDFQSKQMTILSEAIPWDIETLELSGDGSTLAFTANEDGVGSLYLMNTATGDLKTVTNMPIGQIYGLRFHPDNHRLAIVLNTAQTPGDVFVLDVSDMQLYRWTTSEVGGLDTDKFIEPQLIHYPTFDQVEGKPREIPAFVYKPRGEGPHPVLIQIHGGPESQFIPYFSATFQYYLNEMGIAVIAPNVRGSSGYGKSYLLLDNAMKREDSVKDIGALLDWIATQPDLDKDRVAVMGGSYGGYMVLASLIHYPARLAAGIDVVGISNFVTFLENTQDYRRDLRRVEYGDERNEEMRKFLESISPTNNAGKIEDPLFIAQGQNDPRVPASEAEQMVQAIREKGHPVWYLLATDEGHGFAKKTNRDYFTNAVVLFLEKFLLGKEE
jgi:dipeptidyl aminopeptidase/acylaminoacyl peptidase